MNAEPGGGSLYTGTMKVLGLAGSLRRASCNRGLLRAAAEVLDVQTLDLGDLPLYNADDEVDPPAPVRQLRKRVRASDAILFATPEYNYSVPGVLKNAIDWGSQPKGHNVWDGKPAAIIGAAASSVGTARAQLHLRQSLVALNMRVFNTELLVGGATARFDAEGNLTDPETRAALREFLTRWIPRD
jgi:chromate reductase